MSGQLAYIPVKRVASFGSGRVIGSPEEIVSCDFQGISEPPKRLEGGFTGAGLKVGDGTWG